MLDMCWHSVEMTYDSIHISTGCSTNPPFVCELTQNRKFYNQTRFIEKIQHRKHINIFIFSIFWSVEIVSENSTIIYTDIESEQFIKIAAQESIYNWEVGS